MAKKKFVTSEQLMETMHKLDYKVKNKVCEVFYQMMPEEKFDDDSEMCLRFHYEFENIALKNLENFMMKFISQ